MSECHRSLMLGVSAVAILFGVTAANPSASASRALNIDFALFWVESDPELDTQLARIQNRIVVKNNLIDDLIAGTRTLQNVAHEFDAIDRKTTHYSFTYRDHYPDITQEERAARVVMNYALVSEMPGERRVRLLSRLQAEYRAWFDHEWPG